MWNSNDDILEIYNMSWHKQKQVKSLKDLHTWNIFAIIAKDIPAYRVMWTYLV